MTMIIDWQTSNEDTSSILRVATDVAVLEVYLSGTVIQKTVWCCPNFEQHSENDSALVVQIKSYLQNPNSTCLKIQLSKQGTAFGNRVWNELSKIPFGQTLTYTELAKRVDSGPRAVAGACRRNPFPGIIPCHRVVSVSGLGGFMGQKQGQFVELKRKLLEYESFISGLGNG